VIIDLVVEGVSLLITQRSEFGSVLERAGVDGLIHELQKRVDPQV
jgi:phospholipid transport system substrate-binding protein